MELLEAKGCQETQEVLVSLDSRGCLEMMVQLVLKETWVVQVKMDFKDQQEN